MYRSGIVYKCELLPNGKVRFAVYDVFSDWFMTYGDPLKDYFEDTLGM